MYCEIIIIVLLYFSCLNLSKVWVKLSPKHLKKNHHFHLIPTFQTSQLQVSPNYSFLRFLHMNILYLMSKIWSCRKQHFHLGYNITQQSVHLCKIVERFLRICSIRCDCRNYCLFVIAEKSLVVFLIFIYLLLCGYMLMITRKIKNRGYLFMLLWREY